MIRSCVAILAFVVCCTLSAESIRCLVVARDSLAQPNVKMDGGTIEIHGSASIQIVPQSAIGSGDWVIELEYFCVGGVEQVTVTTESANGSSGSQTLEPLGHSEAFRPYIAKIEQTEAFKLADAKRVSLDLTMKDDAVLQIRSVQLRRQMAGDFEKAIQSSGHAADSDALQSYLSHSFDGQVSSVTVGKSEIKIAGMAGSYRSKVLIGDIPMETLLGDESPYRELVDVAVRADGSFEIVLPRATTAGGRQIDRLTDRWQLFHRE